MIDYDMVTKALQYLVGSGWSDLIDKRWKKKVTNELKDAFPDMNKTTLEHVLECVLF
jgi:hypothetical protein